MVCSITLIPGVRRTRITFWGVQKDEKRIVSLGKMGGFCGWMYMLVCMYVGKFECRKSPRTLHKACRLQMQYASTARIRRDGLGTCMYVVADGPRSLNFWFFYTSPCFLVFLVWLCFFVGCGVFYGEVKGAVPVSRCLDCGWLDGLGRELIVW